MLTANGEPVPEPTLRRQLAFGLTPHDCTTGGTREIWAELPKRNGQSKSKSNSLTPKREARLRTNSTLRSPGSRHLGGATRKRDIALLGRTTTASLGGSRLTVFVPGAAGGQPDVEFGHVDDPPRIGVADGRKKSSKRSFVT